MIKWCLRIVTFAHFCTFEVNFPVSYSIQQTYLLPTGIDGAETFSFHGLIVGWSLSFEKFPIENP